MIDARVTLFRAVGIHAHARKLVLELVVCETPALRHVRRVALVNVERLCLGSL
jgi:hypothetical protein